MTISLVQSNYNGNLGSSPCNLTFTSAQTAGNLIIVIFGTVGDSSETITSIVDSKSNPYHLFKGPQTATGDNIRFWGYYAYNIASAVAGTNTVTVTFTGASPQMTISEWSGVQGTSDPLIQAVGGDSDTNGLATSISQNLNTGSVNGALIYGFQAWANPTEAGGAGFTVLNDDPTNFTIDEYLIQATGGSINVTGSGNTGSASGWTAVAAAFKPGTSGPIVVPPTGLIVTPAAWW